MKWMLKRKRVISSIIMGAIIFSFSSPLDGIKAAPNNVEDVSVFSSIGQKSVSSNLFNLIQKSPILYTAAASTKEQRVIVTFKDKKKINKSTIQKGKGKIKRENKHTPTLVVTMPANEIEVLKEDPTVESVEPDIQLQAASQTMDWGVSVVNATYAWSSGYTGKGVKVAVLDTGVDTHHDDLVVSGGASFVDYTTSYDDDNGHGTNVAGVISAKNNNIGVSGVAPDADIYAVKVLDSTRKGYLSDVIAGIDWAVDTKMDVINMSMATSVDSPALHKAVDQAYENGLLVVAAAGNTGNPEGNVSTIQYPAKYSSVISVGAVDLNNQRASFSATGSELEIVAPGVGINSTYLNNGYSKVDGTSIAAPFVTGVISILRQQNPSSTNKELRKLLDQHVTDLGDAGKDSIYGYGLLNVASTLITDIDPFPSQPITENVYSSVYNQVYATAMTGPTIKYKDTRFSPSASESTENLSLWPSLVNAKSVSFDTDFNSGPDYRYVLYNDNTIKYTVNNTLYTEDTRLWPDLTNSKHIAFSYNRFGNYTNRYVLYNDNTIKYTSNATLPNVQVYTEDPILWPSLTNVKAFTFDFSTMSNSNSTYTFRYVLYNDNTIKYTQNASPYKANTNYIADPSLWPDLTNAKAISFKYGVNYYNSANRHVAYLDQNPSISILTTSNQTTYKNSASNVITLSGSVSDADNDNVTVTASIAGVTKSVAISNIASPRTWTLQWNIDSENIPAGSYSNIVVSANDTLWGSSSITYLGTIFVDNVPNPPTGLNPGSVDINNPLLTSGAISTLNWTFLDADAGDNQSAYNVQIFNSSGSLILDTGWIASGISSYSLPVNTLARGGTYSWRVAVKDSKNGVSTYSPLSYIKINLLPTLSITSYTDGQQMSDNIFNFTWTYSDANGQAQSKYQVQGSRDNWATIGYDSGMLNGTANSMTITPLPDGAWSFKVYVYDGLEWSIPATRNNLIVPNAYEPNENNGQAFKINYNASYTSTINSATDIDFFKYTAPETGIDRLTLEVPTGKNYDVYVYDASLKFVSAGMATDFGSSEDAIFRANSGATYYIKVVGVGGDFSASPYKLKVSKFVISFQTNYQFDSNGNITNKQTSSSFKQQPSSYKSFDGSSQLTYNNVAVNTAAGAKTTVSFWMNWDGTEGVMPIGWSQPYDLWFTGGSFGFNTGEGNLLGVSSASLKDSWVYVTAVFSNSVPSSATNEIYINGVKQILVQAVGSTTVQRSVTNTFIVSGWGPDQLYKFKGKIGDVEVWNRALTQQEIQNNMNANLTGSENGLVGYWKLHD